MSKDKRKTMDQVIKELNTKSNSQRKRILEKKLRALAESAKILGLDVMLIANDPDNGFETAMIGTNKLPAEAEGSPWSYMAALLRALVLHFLNFDAEFVVPVLDAINSCPAIEAEINMRRGPKNYNNNEQE